jgi:hypothetical protein
MFSTKCHCEEKNNNKSRIYHLCSAFHYLVHKIYLLICTHICENLQNKSECSVEQASTNGALFCLSHFWMLTFHSRNDRYNSSIDEEGKYKRYAKCQKPHTKFITNTDASYPLSHNFFHFKFKIDLTDFTLHSIISLQCH